MSVISNMRSLLVTILLFFMLSLFFFGDLEGFFFHGDILEGEFKSIFVIFMGIFLEAIPFLLIGVIFSSIIHEYISEDYIKRWIPKHPVMAVITAILIAAITPVCECAIIPVVRRLIQKGVPLHAGMAILTAAPILNFVVFGSTFFAFQNDPAIYIGRMALCIAVSFTVALIIYVFFTGSSILRKHTNDFTAPAHHHHNYSRFNSMVNHSIDEFFLVGKYFILGGLLATAAQVYLNRGSLIEASSDPVIGTALMMGLAYLLSLCSEADAFVAAAFQHVVPQHSILAFLVFGPMLDLKNTLVMLASFKTKFVLFFILIVTVVVFLLCMLAGVFLKEGLV
ncbi:permease [Cytobacillus gottheilii]|uniref:permease n=1 Tax=Cytobacillus gottheilii TaxID=859144 RepID=UPI00082B880D|nr:permease [Cytobacillus gottheilii]